MLRSTRTAANIRDRSSVEDPYRPCPPVAATSAKGLVRLRYRRVASAIGQRRTDGLMIVSAAVVVITLTLATSPAVVAAPESPVLGRALSLSSNGYAVIDATGGVITYGHAGYDGDLLGSTLNAPIVGAAAGPGAGYWMDAADGGVFAFGSADFYGSMGGRTLDKPVVGMATTPDRRGYWLVAADGGIFAFGGARFYGSMGGRALNKPMVGMAATPDGRGYWLVGSDGGVFAFGDARFYGSTGSLTLNRPIVGIQEAANGNGYWLVGSDGGIFSFGDAPFYGSLGADPPGSPIAAMTATPDGDGYWMVGRRRLSLRLWRCRLRGRGQLTSAPTALSRQQLGGHSVRGGHRGLAGGAAIFACRRRSGGFPR